MIFKFHKQTRNTLILDEPFRFLSEEFQPLPEKCYGAIGEARYTDNNGFPQYSFI